jgi:hypothetical protein
MISFSFTNHWLLESSQGKARDPYLAYIMYAKGLCDEKLIVITNDNSMFKQHARYL